MIVCLCKGVSSRTILDEARRGACTLKQIRQLLDTVSARHEHHDAAVGVSEDR